MNLINITNPEELFLDNIECPEPLVFLTDDELEYLQRRVFE